MVSLGNREFNTGTYAIRYSVCNSALLPSHTSDKFRNIKLKMTKNTENYNSERKYHLMCEYQGFTCFPRNGKQEVCPGSNVPYFFPQ